MIFIQMLDGVFEEITQMVGKAEKKSQWKSADQLKYLKSNRIWAGFLTEASKVRLVIQGLFFILGVWLQLVYLFSHAINTAIYNNMLSCGIGCSFLQNWQERDGWRIHRCRAMGLKNVTEFVSDFKKTLIVRINNRSNCKGLRQYHHCTVIFAVTLYGCTCHKHHHVFL